MRSPVLLVLFVLVLSGLSSIDAIENCKAKTPAPAPVASTDAPSVAGEATTVPTKTRHPRAPRATPSKAPAVPVVTTAPKPAATTTLKPAASTAPTAAEATTAPKTVTPKASTSPAAAAANSTASGGKCITGDPTSDYISKADVDWIWEHRMKSNFATFTNFIFDQLMANNGKLSYCIRWDSTNKLPKATAAKFKAMLDKQYAQWNKWLVGYGCWPFAQIELEIVGVAVRSKDLVDWADDSLGPIYTDVKDSDGVPMCPENCYKHRDFAKSSDTSACKGKPFDISLWPTLGQGGGAGGDWGQRVDEASMLATLEADTSVIVAHEIGHGFGLPDFYEEADKPRVDMAKLIMQAGASMSVTEGDGWLIRRGWENVRMRYPSTSG